MGRLIFGAVISVVPPGLKTFFFRKTSEKLQKNLKILVRKVGFNRDVEKNYKDFKLQDALDYAVKRE